MVATAADLFLAAELLGVSPVAWAKNVAGATRKKLRRVAAIRRMAVGGKSRLRKIRSCLMLTRRFG